MSEPIQRTEYNRHKEICQELFKGMDNKLDDLKKDINNIRIDIAKLPEVFLEKADERYAPIRTWTIMVWAGGIVGFIIIAGVIGVIAQSYLHLNI